MVLVEGVQAEPIQPLLAGTWRVYGVLQLCRWLAKLCPGVSPRVQSGCAPGTKGRERCAYGNGDASWHCCGARGEQAPGSVSNGEH